MIVKGRDIIIQCDGEMIAAAKSGSISYHGETIPTATAMSGNAKEFLPGRTEWSVSLNTLVSNEDLGNAIKAYATLNGAESVVTVNGRRLFGFDSYDTNKLHLVVAQYAVSGYGIYDVRSFSDAASMLSYLQANQSSYQNKIISILSLGTFEISTALAEWIETYLKVADVPTVTSGEHCAFALVSSYNVAGEFNFLRSDDAQATISLIFQSDNYYTPSAANWMTKPLGLFGKKVKLSLVQRSAANNRLQGEAICVKWDCQFNQSNLTAGSFEFKGTGPLT